MIFCSKCGTKLQDDAAFCSKCGTPTPLIKKDKEETSFQEDIFKTRIASNTDSYGRVNFEKLPEGYEIDERYKVKEKIGQGGFGAVYRVYDKKMEIEKALKVVPEAIANDEEAMANLSSEAKTMAKLTNDNIVRVYEFSQTGDIKYLDMEFIGGGTLTSLKLKGEGKKLSEEKTLEIGKEIAKGLSYAHKKQVIHKDIKPANILLTKDGKAKIMDFGISETVRTSMSRINNSSSSGTLVYMSPEQIRGKDIGREADIYSFGAMLYELLSGNPPFYKGDINYQILNEKPSIIEGISEKTNSFLQKCLAKDYKDRFRNFEQVIDYLEGKENIQGDVFINVFAIFPPTNITNTIGTEFILVEKGTFQMGSNNGDSDEKPIHTVNITKDYYIGKYEVTQKQWKAVMGSNLSYFKGDNLPVERVSWNDVQEFIEKLNQKEGTYKYRLPTEAEWEYAARGGNKSKGYTYSGSNNISDVAWYWDNSGIKTHIVGTKSPNELGIYDMTGNVYEWCNDWYGNYSSGSQNDPQGANSGSSRVLRGGSWSSNAYYCRVANRSCHSAGSSSNFNGFRLSRTF